MSRTLSFAFRAGILAVSAMLVASCAGHTPSAVHGKKAAWRDVSERACLSRTAASASAFVTPVQRLGGPGACGALQPFKMSAADHGRVAFRPAAILRCPMVDAVEAWFSEAVVPISAQYLGSPVVAVNVAASYSCRTRNSQPFAKLSEHGLANALDISAFHLADGRKVTLRRGWQGTGDERAFLRAVHASACERFTTVLGPDADRFHHDHFHVDLARHGRKGTYRVCR